MPTLDDLRAARDAGTLPPEQAAKLTRYEALLQSQAAATPPPDRYNPGPERAVMAQPTWGDFAAHQGAEMAGGTFGDLAGTAAGTAAAPFAAAIPVVGPPIAAALPVVGGMAGAAIGGVGGRLATDAVEGRRPTWDEMQAVAQRNAEGAVLGRGIGRAVGAVFGGASRHLTPRDVSAIAEAQRGGVPLGAQDTTQGALGVAAGWLTGANPIGRTYLARFAKQQDEALGPYIARVASQFGPLSDKPAAGRMVQQSGHDALVAAKQAGHELYLQAGKTAADEGIMVPLDHAAGDLKAIAGQLEPFTKDPAFQRIGVKDGLPPLADTLRAGLDAIQNGATELPVDQVAALKSAVHELTSNFEMRGQSQSLTQGFYDSLEGGLSHAIEGSVKGTAAEAPFTFANTHHATVTSPLRKAMKTVNVQDPSSVVSSLVSRPDQLASVMRVLDPEAAAAARTSWLMDQARRATDAGTGLLKPGAFAKAVGGLDDAAKRALFGPHYEDVERAVNLVDHIAKGRTKTLNTSGTAVALATAQGVGASAAMAKQFWDGDVKGGLETAAGGAGLLGLAAVLTNPRIARYLTMGFMAKQGSPLAKAMGAKLVDALGESSPTIGQAYSAGMGQAVMQDAQQP